MTYCCSLLGRYGPSRLYLLLGLMLFLAVIDKNIVRGSNSSSDSIETFTLSTFPNHRKIAMHFPCAESNVFPTKCMCHIRCLDKECRNAKEVCLKYKALGCQYLIMRGGRSNRFATLKRKPTVEERDRLQDVSKYSKVVLNSSALVKDQQIYLNTTVHDMVLSEGQLGQQVIDKLFDAKITPSSHCGQDLHGLNSSARLGTRANFLASSVALVVLSYHAPRTLLNSMLTWQQGGLLGVVKERVALLNDPLDEEVGIAKAFGFRVVQPQDIPGAKTARRNVLTIGAAFYYSLHLVQSEFVLFLENDFKLDLQYGSFKLDLLAGLGMLQQGVQLVRLQSRSYQGCGNFLTCQQGAEHVSMGEKKRNWYTFYCPGKSPVESHVSDCFALPSYRCFTSWDTNWSLNAALMRKSTMLSKKYHVRANVTLSLPEIGLRQFESQDGLESAMIYSLPWAQWKVPLCISLQGLFIHEEIETGS